MSKLFSFPPFTVDVGEERVWKGRQEIALRRKPFAILKYLLANPARLVTHDEVLEHVWGGTVVSESALRSHLHELRQTFGEGVIETVIGRGYRFVAKLDGAVPVSPAAPATVVPVDSTVVGRSAELAMLDEALERAMTGHRQICFVTGEPGIGKTTLVDTFLASLGARGIRGVRGNCIEQYGTPEPYHPMIELLGRLRAERGEQVIATFVRYAPSFTAQLPHLLTEAQLAEVSRHAGAGAEARMMRELVETLEILSSEQTLVMVLEDLQWSDVATIDMLSLLGQRRERAKLLVLATARRAEANTTAHPLNRVMRNLVTRFGAVAIALDRIERTDMRVFLERRFPGHAFPDSFLDVIERITGGTPLFMVSIANDLVERKLIEQRDGAWRLSLASDELESYRPTTVRQLIDIQLDRLDVQEQRVLEAASLIGAQFSTQLLAPVLEMSMERVEEICEGLARRGLFLQALPPVEWIDGSPLTRFGVTHALVQEVCFERAPVSRRMRWHRAIAEHIEKNAGPRLDEIAYYLAPHFEQGQLLSRALHYYIVAASRTARRYSLQDASRLYRRANEILKRIPEARERDVIELQVLDGLSQAVTLSSDRSRHEPVELFQRMTAIARKLGETSSLYRATVNLYFRHGTLAEYASCDVVERELTALEQTATIAPDLRVFSDAARGICAMWQGHPRRGLALLEPITSDVASSGPIGGILGETDRVAFLMNFQCTMRWVVGDADRALEEALRGVAQAERVGDPYSLGATLTVLARLRFLRRDPPRAIREAAERVASIAEADVWYTQAALYAAAARSADAPIGDREIDELERMFELRTTTFPMGAPALGMPLVEIHRRAGKADRALALVERMLAFIRDRGEALFSSEFHRLRGELLEPADRAAAAASYEAAMTAARAIEAPIWEQRARDRLAALASR